jgi:D-alanine--poly(phosphoribitol) ligase subunit 2
MTSKLTTAVTEALLKVVGDKGLDIQIKSDTDMFAADLLDSLQFLMLITQLESQFDIEVDFSEFDPEEFRTVEGFVQCLTR